MRKVRITGLPNKAAGGQTGQSQGQGIRRFMDSTRTYDSDLNPFAAPDVEVNRTLQPVDRREANIEAEKGEIIMVPGMGGIPETYIVGGNRHADGGAPLKADKESFVYSDNKSNKYGMKIKDKELLKDYFGMTIPKKGFRGYTPAEIAKKYDINKQKEILMDPNSDKIARETAEMNIEKFNLKLGQLALIQESMKGFPDGAPKAAEGYMSHVQMDPKMFDPQQGPQQGMPQQGMQPQQPMMAQDGIAGVTEDYSLNNMFADTPQKFIGKYHHDVPTTYNPDTGEYVDQNIDDRFYMTAGDRWNNFKDLFRREEKEVSPTRKVSYVFQRGGQYDGAFWNSIMQDGGGLPEAQNGLSMKEKMENRRYDRYMRNNPDMEWTPIPEAPIVDPAQAVVAQQGTTPQPGVTPETTTTTTTTTTDETEPVASKKPTYTYNVPDKYRDNDMYDESSETYDPSVIKKGDYIKRADGKWYKATGLQPIHGTYTGDDMETTFGNNADVAGAYAYLQTTFEDPEVREAYAESTRAALRNKEYYKGKSGGYSDMYTEEEIKNLTDDQLVEQFLKHQKRNYSLQANGVDPEDFQDANGNIRSVDNLANVMAKRKKADGTLAYPTPEAARAEAERRLADYKTRGITSLNSAFDAYGLGITDEEIAAGDLGVEQASYWGYHDLIKDRENLSPELQAKLQYLTEPQEGFSDEPGIGTISPIDSKSKNFYTNTTAGQLSVVKGDEMGYEEADLMDKEKDPIEPGKPQFAADDWLVNPWAQDVMNLGNLVNTSLSRKKYLPHSYPIDFANPDVLYHDPARAVATTNEQSGMARRANTAFAGPQSTYRNTGIAGKTWAKNLDTIGQYENMNVPIGNAYYDKVWEADRIQTMSNADRMQRLFDQNTIANQQWDNTKVADRRNITDARIQMLTNMMETQAWNQQFPNFNTQPGIGGGMWKTGYNRPFVNTGMPGQSNNYLAQYQKLKQQYPEASDKAIENQLSMQYGTPQGGSYPGGRYQSPYDQQRAEQAAFAAQYGAINPMAYRG
jgi:hypothetical protein